ncbi:MAG TPA: hypothetical protein VFS74_11340 [Gemmatimonadales bacterium]|nr:hypothetical protein [Gemmatimonadales bacterium]
MKIPEIRERLHVLAEELGVRELHRLAEETRRRPYARVAPVKSRPIDPAVRKAVRAYAAAHPDAHQREIGQMFNLNPGRVSESLRGKRT